MGDVYIVQPSELTAVADAIREKGETSAQLVFPGGFVSAIQDISGGGLELNFEIVGGTTRPTNPKENTIWVNTDQEITGWIFSNKEPDEPAEGIVWIYDGSNSFTSFNALKENAVIVHPVSCMQYVSGVFQVKTAMTYANGEWKDWHLWLYNSGDLCEEVTGGWDSTITLSSGWTKVKLTLNQDHMTGDSGYAHDAYRCTSNAIDLSGQILYMRYSLVVTTKNAKAFLRVYSKLASNACVAESSSGAIAAGGSIDRGILSVDCSNITTPVYVVVDSVSGTSGAAATFTVHDVWAEGA